MNYLELHDNVHATNMLCMFIYIVRLKRYPLFSRRCLPGRYACNTLHVILGIILISGTSQPFLQARIVSCDQNMRRPFCISKKCFFKSGSLRILHHLFHIMYQIFLFLFFFFFLREESWDASSNFGLWTLFYVHQIQFHNFSRI